MQSWKFVLYRLIRSRPYIQAKSLSINKILFFSLQMSVTSKVYDSCVSLNPLDGHSFFSQYHRLPPFESTLDFGIFHTFRMAGRWS